MSFDSQAPLFLNGNNASQEIYDKEIKKLNDNLEAAASSQSLSLFHGDEPRVPARPLSAGGFWGKITDLKQVFTLKNTPAIAQVAWKYISSGQVDMVAGASIIGSLDDDSKIRAQFIEKGVTEKYQKMLHPPITYLGDAFQYRTVDGKFNNVLVPHLGQGGTPYAKTIPSITHTMGALPDPGDVYDRLMAREGEARESESGLSSMLLYHATILIHDIFRTNKDDKNISDSSSYLDLSPLYGYTEEMQRQVRDDTYKRGLLKPDTFAEERLLRQPPGVCIMLVMYNRYHNYVATQLLRINENGRFSIPRKFARSELLSVAKEGYSSDRALKTYVERYEDALDKMEEDGTPIPSEYNEVDLREKMEAATPQKGFNIEEFLKERQDAWNKLDDDLFNTARLITCGLYVNISIHDYLRALMGFHQFNTTFTLDPRIAINKDGQRDAVSRGIGNQVTTEFNLLYRFHCAISKRDEFYVESFMKETLGPVIEKPPGWNPKTDTLTLDDYLKITKHDPPSTKPCEVEFGLRNKGELSYYRNEHSGLFDDKQMVNELLLAMDAPIGNFGAKNVPKSLKAVEMMGIIQARKWDAGTLNDFRDFFGLGRHRDFTSITGNVKIQNALRDLYDHPDNVELYPGIFCEGDAEGKLNLDPGPNEKNFTLWVAIFSDAITLVRSDRFYTVDWNTKSLTSWGMKEVTPDPEVLKSSMFNRLIQRAFPGWFPYDSIRFFHPFYTGPKNAQYAREQGFEEEFRISCTRNPGEADYKYELSDSDPRQPVKPVYLVDFPQITAVLSNENSRLIHHCAAFHSKWMPKEFARLLTEPRLRIEEKSIFNADPNMVSEYFKALTREMINREAYVVDDGIYQIDVTRDLAVPVVTRFLADFLGFNHRVKGTTNLSAEYTEDQIYQHITNCQLFFAYTADETKMLKRRAAAKKSLDFLLNLTVDGHIKTANGFFHGFSRFFRGEKRAKNMTELGLMVAEKTLTQEGNDARRAAAILVLTALDSAYNSVLAFSAILNYFMDALYEQEKEKQALELDTSAKICDWQEIEQLVQNDNQKNNERIRYLVMKAQRLSVRLPVVRKAAESGDIWDQSKKKVLSVMKGQVIICDIVKAYAEELKKGSRMSTKPEEYYMFGSNFSDGLSQLNLQEVAITGLTAMIKVLAQTKNLRRGHDTQGRLKKIRIDQTTEGYANFIAPERMDEIRDKVKKALESPTDVTDKNSKTRKDAEKIESILNEKILQPVTDTYMTSEWDEMVTLPVTWKLRFDGYGRSDYRNRTLNKPAYPDDRPPFYQPQGSSRLGGAFSGVAPAVETAKVGKDTAHDEMLKAAAGFRH